MRQKTRLQDHLCTSKLHLKKKIRVIWWDSSLLSFTLMSIKVNQGFNESLVTELTSHRKKSSQVQYHYKQYCIT